MFGTTRIFYGLSLCQFTIHLFGQSCYKMPEHLWWRGLTTFDCMHISSCMLDLPTAHKLLQKCTKLEVCKLNLSCCATPSWAPREQWESLADPKIPTLLTLEIYFRDPAPELNCERLYPTKKQIEACGNFFTCLKLVNLKNLVLHNCWNELHKCPSCDKPADKMVLHACGQYHSCDQAGHVSTPFGGCLRFDAPRGGALNVFSNQFPAFLLK